MSDGIRSTGVDLGKERGWHPLGSDTEGSEICLAPSVFLASDAHLALKAKPTFNWKQASKFRFNKIISQNQGVNKKSEILD